MSSQPFNPPIPPEVIAEEIHQLEARRALVFPESADPPPGRDAGSAASPSARADVPAAPPPDERSAALTELYRRTHGFKPFGVALSGGGIRSATFNLGLLQGLAERGLLPHVDYLSTVSGGGYIGSWLHGIIRNRFNGDPRQASRFLSPADNAIPGTPEDDPVSFLRKYSNYLVPRPALFSADSWVIGVIWLRNVLLNQLILLPTVAAGILTLLIGGLALQVLHASPSGAAPSVTLGALAIALAAVSVAVWIAYTNLRILVCQSSASHGPPRANPAPKPASRKPAERLGQLAAPLVFLGSLLIGCIVLPAGTRGHLVVGGLALVVLLALILLKGGFVEGLAWRHRLDRPAAQRRAWWHVVWMVPVTAAVTIGPIIALARPLDFAAGGPSPWVTLALGPPAVCASIIMGIGLLIGLMGADYADGAREWISYVGSMLALLCAAWLAAFALVVFGPWAVAGLLERYTSVAVAAFGGWLATTAGGVFAGRSTRTGGSDAAKPGWLLSLLTTVAPTVFLVGYVFTIAVGVHAALHLVTGPYEMPVAAAAPSREVRSIDLDITTAAGESKARVEVRQPTPPWLTRALAPVERFGARYWVALSAPGAAKTPPAPGATGRSKILWLSAALVGCLAVAAVASGRFNINEFSMHHFYKNRLVRCYLGASNSARRRPNRLTGFDPTDDFPVATLVPTTPTPYCGPYAIINAALNLNAGSELAQQERKAASFVFTPRHSGFVPAVSKADREEVRRCGGAFRAEGYRATEGYSSPTGPEVGTTLAISGAAANPNGGYHTSGPMAFLMTVFDARLGWWLGNPRWTAPPERTGPCERPGPMFAWTYLVAELLGRTTGRSKFVNLSDGGHFDNLGLYELVRRRCRYIIIGDAEEDPGLKFESLGGAIRKCRADFGVEIDIDPGPIRAVNGRSAKHCVMGTVQYPETDPETRMPARGYLFYVKASLTGDEPSDVVEYQGRFPEFPHQKTLDQFFSESQFESYRRLGVHIARDAFEGIPEIAEREAPGVLAKTFEQLESKWYAPIPVTSEAASRLADAYSALVRSLSAAPGLDALACQLFDNGVPAAPREGARPDRQEVAAVLELIQLVQNVFTEFHLEHAANRANPRNSGWMCMFHRWRTIDAVDRVWRARRVDYNPLFQQFMEELRNGHDTAGDRPLRP